MTECLGYQKSRVEEVNDSSLLLLLLLMWCRLLAINNDPLLYGDLVAEQGLSAGKNNNPEMFPFCRKNTEWREI